MLPHTVCRVYTEAELVVADLSVTGSVRGREDRVGGSDGAAGTAGIAEGSVGTVSGTATAACCDPSLACDCDIRSLAVPTRLRLRGTGVDMV